MSDRRVDVAVVGAGLAGLVAGATAAGVGARTVVLDGHAPGGRASTDVRGPFRFNRGPHALYRGGEADAVLGRLGVTVDGAAPPNRARGRSGDRIGVLPGDTLTLARTRLLRTRSKPALARLLAGCSKWRPEEAAGLTIGQWLDGFGLPDDARALLKMLVRITGYLHDEDTVSADVPAMQIPLALGNGVRYLHGGWASLVDGLAGAARRNGAELWTPAGVDGVTVNGDRFTVHGAGGDWDAGSVVLAAGPPAANAALFSSPPAAWSEAGPPVEASCLDLGLAAKLRHPVLFGVERPLYLVDQASVTRDIAPAGAGLVHVMRNLGINEEASAAQLRGEMDEHARLAGIKESDVVEQRFLLRMTVVGATPSPATGGLAGRPGVTSTGVEGLYVAGDWVGPSGWMTDAACASGETAGAAAARRAAGLTPTRLTRQDVA